MQNFSLYQKPFICLVRHGETELSASRKYNGWGDTALTKNGENQAKKMASNLKEVSWEAVFCSPLKRARRTAELAGFKNPVIVDDLIEFNYGDYEGKTTDQIFKERRDWDFWKHGCPNGEIPNEAGKRLDNVVHIIKDYQGAVLVFSHSHAIRILTARWLEMPAEYGAIFALEPAHINIIGMHRARPIIILWNDGSHLIEHR